MKITAEMLVNFLADAPVFERFERDEIEAFLPHLEFQGVEAVTPSFRRDQRRRMVDHPRR